jgi:coenzyme Q-binding protein COQ10
MAPTEGRRKTKNARPFRDETAALHGRADVRPRGDVADYPQFIPWIAASRVRSVTPEGDSDVMLADLVVGFKMFRERFLSRVTMWEGTRRIDTEYIEGPFSHMKSTWAFRDLDEGGCEVAFDVDFEFRNKLLQGAAGLFFHEAMQRIVRAFEARAQGALRHRRRPATR